MNTTIFVTFNYRMMNLIKKCCCFILLLLVYGVTIAQTKRIAQLRQEVNNAISDTAKLTALFTLCNEQGTLNPDTLYKYATVAKQLATIQKDAIKKTLADYYLAVQFSVRGQSDNSLQIINAALPQLHYNAAEKEVYINFYMLKARVYNNLNKPKEGLNLLYPILQEAEKQHDVLTQMRAINGMVAAFVSIGDDKEAQQWCYKALQLCPMPLTFGYAEAYNITLSNISITYMHRYESEAKKNYLDSVEVYTNRSIAVSRSNEFLGGLAYALSLKSTLLGYNKKTEEGEAMLKECLALYKQIGNTFYIINTMAVMGNFYGLTNQPEKGIAICKEGIELSKKFNTNIYLYMNLAGNYKLAGDYKNYGETMEELGLIKDSLNKRNSSEALSEIETKYEIQKKENTIIQQNYSLTKKNYLMYGAFGLLLLGGLFSVILFKQNKKRQQLKFHLLQEEEKRQSEIAVSKAEEKERRRIAAELHDNLGGQLSYISSNMDFILDAPRALTEEEKTRHLTKVNETAKNTIADLRESIWALKKQQVHIDELADKLKLFVQNQVLHQQQLQLEIKESISIDTIISSAEALQVFRIFQEAINNALKYAGASTIVLSITADENSIYKIALQDDGKGFDTSITYQDHYGLENMRQRAKDIGASIVIESIWHMGTLISVEKRKV